MPNKNPHVGWDRLEGVPKVCVIMIMMVAVSIAIAMIVIALLASMTVTVRQWLRFRVTSNWDLSLRCGLILCPQHLRIEHSRCLHFKFFFRKINLSKNNMENNKEASFLYFFSSRRTGCFRRDYACVLAYHIVNALIVRIE